MTEIYSTPDPALRTDPQYGSMAPSGTSTLGTSTLDSSALGTIALGTSTSDGGTSDVAKDQAGQVATGAKEAGQQVAGEAKRQVVEVKAEAGNQARTMLGETRGELTAQAGQQQQRVASGLRSIGQELGQMAQGAQQPGPASDLVQQASQRLDGVAQWLESREPGQVLVEVQAFARQRPGAFLALAAGAGLLVGRLARGVKDASSDDGPTQPGVAAGTAPATSGHHAPIGRPATTSTGRGGFAE